ncbi:adenylate/guanylate cyclase domain-containing protein [Polyangium sp. 15x6]|uniref:adenylate/guanylate cyclase domain-containing protein n=1 Tax=Polyangium sp. 15x6 TaxID=3042687 RepID=UPI00249A123A|nr:adenylate/guanylate cyclase domain-containing protein [Polyangium sp. 15x6]MDI3290123.1 adenylate/guanylate cyclase domain-containing protein [Polyangium sp. 15x6]
MKLGSIGARALLLFAAVGLVPVGAVVALLLSVNRQAVQTSEQQLQAAVLEELERVAMRHVEGVRVDADAVAFALYQAANGKPAAGAGDGLEAVRATLGTRRELDAVRFEVPERGVSTVLRQKGDDVEAGADVPASTPETRKAADEHGMGVSLLGPGKGLLVVPIPAVEGAATKARGYVTAALDVADLQREIDDIAGRRFGGAVGLVVVDATRRSVASHGMPEIGAFADTSNHPLWTGFSKENPGVVGVVRVAPYRAESGADMIGVVRFLPGLGWGVALARREEDAFAVLSAMQRRGALVALGAALLALAAAAFSARWIARPIVHLAGQARLVGERRWRELALTSSRTDEIGTLTTELSRMANDLEGSEIEIARQARQRADLGRFLSKELVEAIVSGRHELALGGRRAAVSVLFADVVAFTPLAETRPAEEVVALLNELFSVLTEVVFRHGGTVDKFIGDCIMAVWGAPVAQEDHAARALAAAEDMMRFLETANESFRERYGTTIELGIGINSGEVLVGNIGSDKRMEYTVIGDVVNVAARLEAIARPNQVLVAEATHALVASGTFELSPLGERALTGRSAATKVYELVTA